MTNMLFVFLLNSAWQALAFFLIARIAARLLRKASPSFEYGMWAVSLCAASLAPWLSLEVSRSGGGTMHRRVWQSNTLSDFSLWFGGESQAKYAAGSQHPQVVITGIAVLYVLFVAAQGARLIWGWLQLRRIVSHAAECRDARVLRLSRPFAGTVSGRVVAVVVSPTARVPFAIGFLRPAIVLPNELLTEAEDDEVAAVLAHEFAHIERHDWICNLTLLLVSLPLSFHPCIALMRRKVEACREAACDEFASGCMASTSAYARALLDLAGRLAQPQPSLAAAYKGAALGVLDGSTLGDRIRRLMDRSPRLSPKRTRVTFFVCTAALLAASVVMTSLAFASPSTTDGVGVISGIWTGQFTDQHPGTGLPKLVRTPVCLQLQQSASEIKGSWGCQNVGPAFPIQDAKLTDNRLYLTAKPPAQGDVTVTWSFDLSVTGNQMSGMGHAVRNDGHSWEVEVNLTRKP